MQKVKLNIVPKGVKRETYLSQNDNGRVVRYELFNELIPYTLDGSETITLTVVRPDGYEIVSNVPNTEEAYIDVTYTDNMSAIAGVGAGEIKITDGETVLGSHNFDINVEIDAYNGRDVVIETATGTLLSFNTDIEDNALEYESEIPYNAEGYTGLEIVNSRTAPVFNKAPYLYRKTPDGAGNNCINKLVGASVAYNQLAQIGSGGTKEGVTCSKVTNDGRYRIHVNGTYVRDSSVVDKNIYNMIVGATAITDHVYYFFWNNSSYYRMTTFGGVTSSSTDNSAVIKKANSNNALNIAIRPKDDLSDNTSINEYLDFGIIDLTAFFGSSTIADYLYNLETQTAGAGVQKFKELGFNKPYYPFNAGALKSSIPVARRVIGFNQWNGETESGVWRIYSGGDGSKGDIAGYIRCKELIKVFPNTAYHFVREGVASDNRFGFYDSNGNYLGYDLTFGMTINQTNVDFITPQNAYYMSFYFTTNGLGNACLNLHSDLDGQYKPYKEDIYNLGGDTLRGLFMLDSNNNIVTYGDKKTSDGKINRKFGEITFNGSNDENWYITDGYINRFAIATGLTNISENYQQNISNYLSVTLWGTANYTFALKSSGTLYVTLDTSAAQMTVNEFKTYLSNHNVNIQFLLATPTTDSSTPFDNPQEAGSTEEIIDGNEGIEIPCGHDSVYGTDIEYLDIDFDTTIYGGNINAKDGVLSSEYNSDGSVKTTPDIIDITPTPIPVRAGDNNIFNSANGNQTIRYYNQVEE